MRVIWEEIKQVYGILKDVWGTLKDIYAFFTGGPKKAYEKGRDWTLEKAGRGPTWQSTIEQEVMPFGQGSMIRPPKGMTFTTKQGELFTAKQYGGISSGGLTLVGERGPELLNLRAGTQVIPNNRVGGFGSSITQNITISGRDTDIEYGRLIMRKEAQRIAEEMDRSYKGR